MTDDERYGYEYDLRSAENAIEAAGEDPVARATAFRRHAEAQRNMMQAVIVPMFVELSGRSLQEALKPLIVGQDHIKAVVETTAFDLGKLSAQVGDMGVALSATIGRVDVLEETQHDHTQHLALHDARMLATEQRVDAAELRITAVEHEQLALRAEIKVITTQLEKDRLLLRRISQEHGGGV